MSNEMTEEQLYVLAKKMYRFFWDYEGITSDYIMIPKIKEEIKKILSNQE